MQEIIQLSQLVSAILIIVGAVGGIITFFIKVNKMLTSIVEMINELKEKNKQQDIARCKDYLTDFTNDIRNDVLKSDVQIKRFHEVYDEYVNDLHQNSYVHGEYEELKGKGLI